MIFIIDDDEIMAKCIKKAINDEVRIFSNAIEAMAEISENNIPEIIFLDILLNGPDGFTFLNELMSYEDTMKIPVVIVSSLNINNKDLSEYGVVGILNKDTMTPNDIRYYVNEYAK